MANNVQLLPFKPIRGLSSPHVQTIISTLFKWGGKEPPSVPLFIPLEDGDSLYCMLSTPSLWRSSEKTVLLIHGLGGTHSSPYMVRMSRKCFQKGWRVLRINLRGNGQGNIDSQKPYHGGLSSDIFQAIQFLKNQAPASPIVLVGYSLGGNMALKLAAELEAEKSHLLSQLVAICPPIDLSQTVHALQNRKNQIYHRHYIKKLNIVGNRWLGNKRVGSILEYDQAVTAAQWGYRDAFDYYQQGSSCHLLEKINHPCHIIFAEDDPFVDYREALKSPLNSKIHICLSKWGGHMGFLGWAGGGHGWHWMDGFLMKILSRS